MMKPDSQGLLQTNQNMHWAVEYIGRPWVNGAQGPDSFDCWSFFRFIQREKFGIDVPAVDIDADHLRSVLTAFSSHDELKMWNPVNLPGEGDAVLMRHSKHPSHIGLYINVDGGGVLHCVRGEGVVFSTLTSLKLTGWGRLEFYRHASDA